MEVVATRPLSVDGRDYRAGDTVKGLSEGKVTQLLAQRQLKTKGEGLQEYVALRSFEIGGKSIALGQRVRVSKLSTDKLHQLLEQRYLEPAP